MNQVFQNHPRLLFWVLITLIALNLVSLSLLGYHYFMEKNSHTDPSNFPPSFQGLPDEKEFLSKALDLSTEQREVIRGFKEEHMRSVEPILRQIREEQAVLVESFMQDTTSLASLEKQTESLGKLQGELKAQTILHFYKIKQLCNPGQKEKLREMVRRILLKEQTGPQGHGKGKGMRHRHRWGRPNQDTLSSSN